MNIENNVTQKESIAFIEGFKFGADSMVRAIIMGSGAHRKPVRDYINDLVPYLRELAKEMEKRFVVKGQ